MAILSAMGRKGNRLLFSQQDDKMYRFRQQQHSLKSATAMDKARS